MSGNRAVTDVLRPGPSHLMNPQQPFMPNQQTQVRGNHMGMNQGNPAMTMLGGNPDAAQAQAQYRHNLQIHHQMAGMQQQQHQNNQRLLRGQTAGGQPMLPASHMSGIPHGHIPQGMNFSSPNMLPQSAVGSVRRVASQPQLNPGAPPLVGMSPGMSGNMAMGMNAQNSMPAQLRQAHQQSQIHSHSQQQAFSRMQQQGIQPHMSPEMPMPMTRGGNPGMSTSGVRSSSTHQAQLMNSLSPPSSIGGPMQHGTGPHHQPNFQNTPPLAPQHQPPLSSSPRPLSQAHTPGMNMSTPGPSHTPVNRAQMTPDPGGMFMNFSNPPYPQGHSNNRMSGSNQFPFVPTTSTPPPSSMSDLPPHSAVHGGTPGRESFQLTPAQLTAQLQGPETYFIPPRPQSHNNHHQTLPNQQLPQSSPLQHRSPSRQDRTTPNLQRPQSQPHMQPGRPPSQAGPSHTPRSSQPQLPGNLGIGGGRMPPQYVSPSPGHQPQASGSSQPQPIAPRPPQSLSTSNSFPTLQTDTPPSGPLAIPRAPQSIHVVPNVGNGLGLMRLLQFSGVLASESKTLQKLQLSWWNDLVKEYFTPKAVMKFTLWKDNQRNEAKPFEIGVPILPRFFLVTTQSGVKSMTLTLDGARERMFAQGHSVVECVTAVWTYKYHNGYTVTLRGPLTAHVVITSSHPPGAAQGAAQYPLKFEDFQFDANYHDKYIALDSVMGSRVAESPKTPRTRNVSTPAVNGTATQQQQREEDKKWEEPRVLIEKASIPGEPVNAFGIPQATMRCLELAESVGQMADLITFSTEHSLGPIDALTQFAAKLRDNQPLNSGHGPLMGGTNSVPQHPFVHFPSSNGVTSTPAVTLYSSAPASVTNPSSNPQPPPSMNSPQNVSPSATSSPQKQHKTISQSTVGSTQPSAPIPSPSVSSGPTNNTPSMANASLKRKSAADAASPSTATSEQPPAKRPTRKRGRTQGGG